MKLLARLLIGLFALLVLAVLAVFFLVDAERLRPQLEATLSESLGRQTQIGALELSLWRLAFEARDIAIAEDPAFGKEPFVAAESLGIRVALWPLLTQRTVHVRELRLERPALRLIQHRDGQWNFSGLAGAEAEAQPAGELPVLRLDRLRLLEGTLSLRKPGAAEKTYRDLNFEIDDLAPDSAAPFRFSARLSEEGSVRLEGTAGPLHPSDAALTPVAATIRLAGVDLARLLSEAGGEAGLAGRMDYHGDVALAQGRFESTGEARIESLRLIETGAPSPQPVEIDYRLDYDLNRQTGKLDAGTLRLGESALDFGGRIDNRGQSAKLDMSLSGKQLSVDRVQALLPMLNIALPENSKLSGGTLDLTLRAQGSAQALVIAGPVALADSKLAGFSLGKRMGQALAVAGLRAPADTVIRRASTQLRVDAAGVRMDRIQAEIAEFGSVEGNGRIGADESLDFHLTARLAPEAVGESGLGGRVGAGLQAALAHGSSQGIGLRVKGTAAAPEFAVDSASLARLGAGAALGAALGSGSESTLDTKAATENLKRKAVDSLFKRLGGGKDEEKEDDDGG